MTARRRSYQFGPFRLAVHDQRLTHEGRVVPLTPKVFDLLRVLVEHRGHLVEKDHLLREVWPDTHVEEGAVNRAVSVLRKALHDNDGQPGQQYIETAPKRGYRFVAPVIECNDEALTAHAESRVNPSPLFTFVSATTAAVVLLGLVWFALPRTVGSRPNALEGPAPLHRQVTFTGREGSPTVSRDGQRIAYVSNQRPEKKLLVQELAGGPPLEIFSAPEINYPRWSPDGSDLLVWARGAGKNGVYLLPQPGGAPRVIAINQFIGCWSPDGTTIATAGALTGTIDLWDTRGRAQRTLKLEGDRWSIWDLDWSATGDRIVFASSDQHGLYTLGTIRADGHDQQTVLSSRTEIPTARWTPQGDSIYYLQRVNQTMSLFRISGRAADEPAGVTGVPIMTGLETDRYFALSADARRLVYAQAPFYSNLWVLDATSGRSTELTHGTSLIERPRISPNGTTVVFNVGHEPRTNLYTVPLTGGGQKQLTFLDGFTTSGAWSADGQRIAFASTAGGRPRVWTVAASGESIRPLSSDELSDNLDVAWGPGPHILYQRAGNQNYYEIDPDSAFERLLVTEGSPGWMFAPVYSPDAAKIAVMWNRPPNRGIWIMDARDRRETLLHPSKTTVRPVGWSKDGQSIYIVEGGTGHFRGATSYVGLTMTDARILRIPATGGAPETVASIPAGEIGTVTMTPDASRFVYPVFSSRSDVWVVDDFDAPLRVAR